MPIVFDATNKHIRINPWDFLTVKTATQGTNIVEINESIPAAVPQTGKIWLGTQTSWIHCFRDFSSGFNYSTNPKHFKIKTTGGGPDIIELDQNCATRAEVVSHINAKLGSAIHDHLTWMHCMEDPFDSIHIVFMCLQASMRCGIKMESVTTYGHPDGDPDPEDAMYHFMLTVSIEDLGDSHIYDYVSWSGSTFVLASNLTQNYDVNTPVTATYASVDMQDVYNEAMDWVDSEEGMAYSIPVSAIGKANLGTGIYTDKIFILNDGWKIKSWSGIYALIILGTTITDDATNRTVSPDLGRVDFEFVTSSYATVVVTSGLSQTDKEEIATYVWNNTVAATLADRVNLIRKIEEGRWRIIANQLVIYDDDNVTPLKIFNLSGESTTPYSERSPT